MNLESQRETEQNLFEERIAKNFPNLVENIKLEV